MDFEKYRNKFDYKTQLNEYREEEWRLYEEFKRDALIEVGLLGHPKADKVYILAWKHAHLYGFNEVFQHLIDLANMLKD